MADLTKRPLGHVSRTNRGDFERLSKSYFHFEPKVFRYFDNQTDKITVEPENLCYGPCVFILKNVSGHCFLSGYITVPGTFFPHELLTQPIDRQVVKSTLLYDDNDTQKFTLREIIRLSLERLEWMKRDSRKVQIYDANVGEKEAAYIRWERGRVALRILFDHITLGSKSHAEKMALLLSRERVLLERVAVGSDLVRDVCQKLNLDTVDIASLFNYLSDQYSTELEFSNVSILSECGLLDSVAKEVTKSW
jgi:hypothetical protein